MIEKYYDGAIEQVAAGLGTVEKNHLLVRYSGQFSVENLNDTKQLEKNEDIFVQVHEFETGEITCAYEPYLTMICDGFRRYMTGTFEEFMETCDVYYLHRPVLLGYFNQDNTGREEIILLDEVAYEQERMLAALERMLCAIADRHPVLFVLNRFQLASKSTMQLTARFLKCENCNIGLVLGVSDIQAMPEFLVPDWEMLYETLDDGSKIYHIGNSGRKKEETIDDEKYVDYGSEKVYRKLQNMVEFLDFDQAAYYLETIERKIKFDNLLVDDAARFRMWLLFVKVSILRQDIPKALEICEDLEKIHLAGKEEECAYEQDYLIATAYMYQGKLKEALEMAGETYRIAGKMSDDYRMFLSELLEAKIQMSGWYNIFFCAQDVKIKESLIQNLIRYNYRNHLAHVYIYAYDNKPEIVKKANQSEELLIYFSRGIRIAKKLGNEYLINMAYQKNIMLSSTNGMYEISLLYSVRTYEALKDKRSIQAGRIYSGIAYNLCAIGENERAMAYYRHAIRLFYHLREPEDIAEVQYNMSLNCIMCGQYEKAEFYLTQCMKAVERLHLNSLRVCNLSKLYGLLALVSILEGNRFNCERYLNNCRQFLNYVIEKEKMGDGFGTVHDYAKVDDDMFLYTFSRGLLAVHDGEYKKADADYEKAEDYLSRSEGNQFFSYALFQQKRMECFKCLENQKGYEKQKKTLEEYERQHFSTYGKLAKKMMDTLPPVDEADGQQDVSEQELDVLLWQESMVLAYKSKKHQLDFISTWQKLIDVTGVCAEEMIDAVMKTFLNHFNVDCAVYARCMERQTQVLYNNTGIDLNEERTGRIIASLKRNPGGYAISKISSNYNEHQDITALFGEDDVCSLVAVPYFNNAKLESFLITYVRMKDNWHSSVNRYMLDEDDLNMYQLLFREVKYSLNRLDAYDKIYEMNNKLYLAAVTDQLTGIYNREGFYRRIKDLIDEFSGGKRKPELGLMFIDLDNFKHYNDTYGHDVGDLVLKEMADIFSGLCEKQGFVCRYGGDEYIIVFFTADKERLKETAKQIYQKIDQADGFEKAISEKLKKQISIRKEQRISCSIGIVLAEDIHGEEEINQMIKRADDLLYSIKTTKKGTYRI